MEEWAVKSQSFILPSLTTYVESIQAAKRELQKKNLSLQPHLKYKMVHHASQRGREFKTKQWHTPPIYADKASRM